MHTENTPPLWYVLEWGISRVLGTGVVALRLLSALAGIATVAVAWAIGAELAGRRAAIVTATLVAVNPLFVWYSQEARAYGLVRIHGLARTAVLLARAARADEPATGGVRAEASLALLTHYFAVFLLIPMALWLMWRALRGGWGDESGMPPARAGGVAKTNDVDRQGGPVLARAGDTPEASGRGSGQLTGRARPNPKHISASCWPSRCRRSLGWRCSR